MTAPKGASVALVRGDRAAAEAAGEVLAMAGDAEGAHATEDALHRRALREIADGHPFPRSLAATVLQTLGADFPRWCA